MFKNDYSAYGKTAIPFSNYQILMLQACNMPKLKCTGTDGKLYNTWPAQTTDALPTDILHLYSQKVSQWT
jgi:hypothetical protein